MKKYRLYLLFIVFSKSIYSQQKIKEIKFPLDSVGKTYLKLTFLNQTWIRYTEDNPGSAYNGKAEKNVFDISLRRTRLQLFGQLTDKVFFYTQFGQNNFSYQSTKYAGSFFHDVLAEYKAAGKYMSLGSGLTGWSGLSRFASPSVGSILSLDAPLYQQATNGVNDQFLRKLSIYAKGKISKLDYRIALSKPMAVSTSTIGNDAQFSLNPPKLQSQAYLVYQFLDEESNLTPYTTGSYLGAKKVFNIGTGIIHQPNAMWYLNQTDTLNHDMTLLGADIFYDAAINKSKTKAISAYVAYTNYDFGNNYIRNLGVMNPENSSLDPKVLNGFGNAVPAIGTGQTIYAQLGYVTPYKKDGISRIQPYISTQYSIYNKLKDPMLLFDAGVNYFIDGSHNSKISFDYQNRPIFEKDNLGDYHQTERKGMYVLQYQIMI